MPDGGLQNHYCVAALQHRLAYNAGMHLPASQQGNEPGPATRGAANRWRARVPFCRDGLLVAALATVGLLAVACGVSVTNNNPLPETSGTLSSLGQAGYRDAGIHLEAGSGFSANGLADISYSAGPTGNAETDVHDAERIAWETLPYRFGVLSISQTSGGCASGVFCMSSSTEIGSETYAQLRAEFGPRPAGLDKTLVSQTDPIPSWLPGLVGACVLAVVIIITHAVIGARRRAGSAGGFRGRMGA